MSGALCVGVFEMYAAVSFRGVTPSNLLPDAQMFLKGRTEALRTVTAEVKAFLETFSDPGISAVSSIIMRLFVSAIALYQTTPFVYFCLSKMRRY